MAGKWVAVAATSPWKATVIKGLLESAGIPVYLKAEAIGRLYGFNLGPLGQVEILVPEEQAEYARELLEAKPEVEAE